MELRIEHIKQVLRNLLDEKMSREDASLWAYNLRQEADNKNIVYHPKESEAILWEAILFIEGIDLQDEPSVYLHNRKDIIDFIARIENTN